MELYISIPTILICEEYVLKPLAYAVALNLYNGSNKNILEAVC